MLNTLSPQGLCTGCSLFGGLSPSLQLRSWLKSHLITEAFLTTLKWHRPPPSFASLYSASLFGHHFHCPDTSCVYLFIARPPPANRGAFCSTPQGQHRHPSQGQALLKEAPAVCSALARLPYTQALEKAVYTALETHF